MSVEPRREFLTRLVGVGAAVAATGLVTGCATAQGTAAAAPVPATSASNWDMSWTSKLGRFKTAYDSPEIYSGAALAYAGAAVSGYRQAMSVERDFTPVLILRHAASVMVLNDAIWERLNLGEKDKLKDPTTGELTKRNPFLTFTPGDKHSMTGSQASIDNLLKQGAILLACNMALMGVAYRLRQKETTYDAQTSLAEVRRHVIPGAYVMPNGIFAVSAAQDAGCHYMRVIV